MTEEKVEDLRQTYVWRGYFVLGGNAIYNTKNVETRHEMRKGPKSISTVPSGPMEHSPLPMIINPGLSSAL